MRCEVTGDCWRFFRCLTDRCRVVYILATVSGDLAVFRMAIEQGTSVQLRDGPAAVTDMMSLPRFALDLSLPVLSLPLVARAIEKANARRIVGSQKDLPHTETRIDLLGRGPC